MGKSRGRRLSKWQQAEINRRQRQKQQDLNPLPTPPLREDAPDGQWLIRYIRAGASVKDYICPGCLSEIPAGKAHLVSWREDHIFGTEYGAAERRHWHQRCWQGRSYRYR